MNALKLKIGVALATLLPALTGCTVHNQDAPDLSGPSELGTSISITVSPDVLPQDGHSQSLVTITARNSQGQPIRGLSLHVETTMGSLSARDLATDSNGRATLVYTAPGLDLPDRLPVPAGLIQIQVRPAETDSGNSTPRTASIRLVLPGDVNPVPICGTGKFSFAPGTPLDHQDIIFDASETTSSEAPIVSYSWDFGDGDTGTGKVTQHSYDAPGTYSVIMVATDAAGGCFSASQALTVGQGQGPTAVFTTSPSSPVPNSDIFFNAVQSQAAPGRTIVKYTWDFGDGKSATGVQVVHRYTNPGSYTVTLVVTDDAGNVGTTTQGISVSLGAPTADFTFSVAGLAVTFNSSPSVPATGRTIVSYSWSFGDPASGSNTSSAANPSHTFSAAGTYNVTVTVTDDVGKTGTITKSVTVP